MDNKRTVEVECPDCKTKQQARAPKDLRHFLYFLDRWAAPSGHKGPGCMDGCVNSQRG